MGDLKDELRFCGTRLDKSRACLIAADGSEISLRPQSLAVFQLLASNAGNLVTREAIFEQVWHGEPVSDDSLAQCIADIRRALGERGHGALRTVPRRGFLLMPDDQAPGSEQTPAPASGTLARRWAIVAAGAVLLGLALTLAYQPAGPESAAEVAAVPLAAPETSKPDAAATPNTQSKPIGDQVSANQASPPAMPTPVARADTAPPVIELELGSDGGDAMLAQRFMAELRAVFARYKTVRVAAPAETSADYRLVASFGEGEKTGRRLLVEASDTQNGKVFSSRTFDVPAGEDGLYRVAVRTAAFASPAGGDLARYLMQTAIHKPVSSLTASECYAHAYDCTTCAGQMDHVSERAVECLDSLLNSNPRNVTALALKGALHAHQYRWGSAVPEPERTDLQSRRPRATMAVEVAEKAASLSDGQDPVVFWGLAQGYMATCEVEKMRDAAHRGLALNPDDPGMLAVFGNWLSYAGYWKEGRAMVERSLAIEPAFYRRWWLMALAKNHYNLDEYDKAYEWFQKSFNERNWVSHLQLAYTLPHLGRLDEAKQAVREAMRWYPGVTLEKALQFYEVGCFSPEFRTKIRDTLIQAGLPSRGSSADINQVRPIAAKVVKVNGVDLEYLDIGEGEPIVFVHGAFADYRAWAPYETRISAKQRFISYTQRLFGNRPWPEPYVEPNLQTYVDDLVGFIEALDIGPVHLVTWSMGGPIGVTVQLERPDLVKSAVHFESNLSALDEDPKRFMEVKKAVFGSVPSIRKQFTDGDINGAVVRVWEMVGERKPGAFDDLPPMYKRGFYDNARSLVIGTLERSHLDCKTLSEIKSPTLAVNGALTNAYWQHLSKRVAECVPGAESVAIEGATHVAPMFSPDELTRLILEHVEKHAVVAR